MRQLSPDGRFEIHSHRRDDDSYMYSDTDYDWWISCVESGDELASFSGSSYQRAGSSTEEGVRSVAFDGDFVVGTRYDGQVERVELPARWQISADRSHITLSYRDGRAETRERRSVIATGKFGDAFALTKLK